ncbi:MAG: hypothetical protein E6L02_02705 [Thaumarchaeota archaeon]|nr:MAG: hypothetical protein E6L02_02705 [Nitrososphaerota archaeon]
MKIETWMHRITNESNLWLNAVKMEEEGNFFEAFFLYLKDAAESLQKNLLVRAALCCSCAANCLSITGNLAASRQLYLQTAMLYEINGDSIIGESVREALWSYKECYEYYHLACDSEKTQVVYDKYVSLARRINPFQGEEEAMKLMSERKKATNATKNDITQTNMQISAQVDNAMENIQKAIESIYTKNNSGESNSESTQYKVKKFEKSLIN